MNETVGMLEKKVSTVSYLCKIIFKSVLFV